MNVIQTALPEVLLIEPAVFRDERGYFMEAFNAARYAAAGIRDDFVQDNVSRTRRGVLRGLHFQHPQSQAKLVSVMAGEVFDVAIDVRKGSPTFGRWVGEYLSADNNRQLYIPAGFAHGFLATADEAVFSYKCSAYYQPATEHTLSWDDARLAIDWPVEPVELSARDRNGATLDTISELLLPAMSGSGVPLE